MKNLILKRDRNVFNYGDIKNEKDVFGFRNLLFFE